MCISICPVERLVCDGLCACCSSGHRDRQHRSHRFKWRKLAQPAQNVEQSLKYPLLLVFMVIKMSSAIMWQHWDWFCIRNNVSSSRSWATLLPISVLENHNQGLFIGCSVFCRVSAWRRTDPRSDVLGAGVGGVPVGRRWGRWDQYCAQSRDQSTLWLFKTEKFLKLIISFSLFFFLRN